MKECMLSRRDQTKVATKCLEIREKWTRPEGMVDLLTSPRDILRRTLRRARLETPDASLFFFPGTSCQATLVSIPPG